MMSDLKNRSDYESIYKGVSMDSIQGALVFIEQIIKVREVLGEPNDFLLRSARLIHYIFNARGGGDYHQNFHGLYQRSRWPARKFVSKLSVWRSNGGLHTLALCEDEDAEVGITFSTQQLQSVRDCITNHLVALQIEASSHE